MRLVEPYRGDPDAWDWKILMLVSALLRGNADGIAWAVLLIIFGSIVFVVGMVLWQIASYLWKVYSTHAAGKTKSARILQFSLIGLVLVWLVSFFLYDPNSMRSWHIHINVLAWSFLLFSIITVWVDKYHEGTAKPPQAYVPSNVRNFLNWKAKQKQP